MAKPIKVPDKLYNEAKKLADEKGLPLWKAFAIVAIKEVTPEIIQVTPEKVPQTKEVTHIKKEVTPETKEVTQDIDMEILDFAGPIVVEIKKRYGKKYLTENDFEKIRERLLVEKGISVSFQDIIRVLENEGYIKRVEKNYLIIG